MPLFPSQCVLYFRIYREVTLPLYAGMVAQICASPDLPLELATTLEDIGQEFMGLAAELNAELLRRGMLGEAADADKTVEARIEALVEEIASVRKFPRSHRDDSVDEVGSDDAVARQALKAAFAMVWDLPSAGQFHLGLSAPA